MERRRKIRKGQTPYTVQAPHALVGIKNLQTPNFALLWLQEGREEVETCMHQDGTADSTDTVSFHKRDPGLPVVRVTIIQATKLQNGILSVAR